MATNKKAAVVKSKKADLLKIDTKDVLTKIMPTSPAKANTAEKSEFNPRELFIRLSNESTSEPETKTPKKGLDEEVADIFRQASAHRNQLVDFFIWYTIGFTVFVCIIILLQALTRMLMTGKESIELIPQWALYLLVVGIFSQFIGLLTIVTKKVWTFEAFFKHADTRHISSEPEENK